MPKETEISTYATTLAKRIHDLQRPSAQFTDPIPSGGDPNHRLRELGRLFNQIGYKPFEFGDSALNFAKSVINVASSNLPSAQDELVAIVNRIEDEMVRLVLAGAEDPARPLIVVESLPASAIIELQRKWGYQIGQVPVPAYGIIIDRLPEGHRLKTVMPTDSLLSGNVLVLGPAEVLYTNMGRVFRPRKSYLLADAVAITDRHETNRKDEERNAKFEREREENQRRNAWLNSPAGQLATMSQQLAEERQQREALAEQVRQLQEGA